MTLDLKQAPLVSLHEIYDVEDEVHYLVLSWHHLIEDHTGFIQIIEEVNAFYNGYFESLPTPALYREYVGRVRHSRATKDYLSYFEPRFSRIESPTLCFGLSNVNLDGGKVLEVSHQLSAELSRDIREQCRLAGINTAALFHAAWGIVAGRTSETEDLAVFGTVLFGRIGNGLQSIGLHINTLPLCLELSHTTKEYVQHVYEELSGLVNHEQASLTELKSLKTKICTLELKKLKSIFTSVDESSKVKRR